MYYFCVLLSGTAHGPPGRFRKVTGCTSTVHVRALTAAATMASMAHNCTGKVAPSGPATCIQRTKAPSSARNVRAESRSRTVVSNGLPPFHSSPSLPRRNQMSTGSTRGPRHTPGIPCGPHPCVVPAAPLPCMRHGGTIHPRGPTAIHENTQLPQWKKCSRPRHLADLRFGCRPRPTWTIEQPVANHGRGARQHGKPSTSARHGDQGSQLRITSPPQKCWGWWPQGNCTSSTKRVGRTDYTVDTATCATGVWFHGMLIAQTPHTEHGAVGQCTGCDTSGRDTSRKSSQG